MRPLKLFAVSQVQVILKKMDISYHWTVGETGTFTTTVLPSTATDKTLTWTSSDNSIASVSSSGVVTAIGIGTVTIRATAKDGSNIYGTKTITVSGTTPSITTDVKVTGITITGNDSSTVSGQTTSSSDSVLKSVSISGAEEVGHKLKVNVKYDGIKPSLEYQWQRASKRYGAYSDINGADEDEYKLKNSDNNKYIKVVVTTTINGQTYTVEDITSKIDKASSNDSSSDTSSEESNNNSSNNNNMVPSNVRPLMPH